MPRIRLLLAILLVATLSSFARSADLEVRREIHFPDLPGYKTLACDLHQHTVFSDGKVWPTVRVEEAWREGLSAIALTDHIEYQPHKEDLSPKFGRSYELAGGAAKAHNILLVRAAEITRDTPPGHFNALFLNDVKPLNTPEFLDAVKQAHEQGAFVFWNHQGWKGEEKGKWLDVHTTLYERKWLQGMEVANGTEYYPSAHRWCLEKKLTMMGNSDIHDPDLRRESTTQDHRTMTLVLVKEPTLPALKEALEAGRTVVWYKEQLIGREELLRPMFEACIEIEKPTLRSKTSMVLVMKNNCQTDITLEPAGQPTHAIVLPAMSTVLVRIPVTDAVKPVALKYTAKNFLIAPGTGMPVTLTIPQ